MALTHDSIKKQRQIPVAHKAFNPLRKYMTKAQAVEENRKLKEREAKIADIREQMIAEDAKLPQVKLESAKEVVKEPVDAVREEVRKRMEYLGKEIKGLEDRISKLRGPKIEERKEIISKEISKMQQELEVLQQS